MNVPNLSDYTDTEREVLEALLGTHVFRLEGQQLTAASPAVEGLKLDWCKIHCAIKAVVSGAACGGNPICLAKVAADLLSCIKGC